jgi:hypothetical protein
LKVLFKGQLELWEFWEVLETLLGSLGVGRSNQRMASATSAEISHGSQGNIEEQVYQVSVTIYVAYLLGRKQPGREQEAACKMPGAAPTSMSQLYDERETAK